MPFYLCPTRSIDLVVFPCLPYRDGRAKIVKGILRAFGKGMTPKDLEKPPRRPGGRGSTNAPWVRIGPFWLEGGPLDPVDAAQLDPATKQRRCVPQRLVPCFKIVRHVSPVGSLV